MKNLLLALSVVAFAFPSCKKCITCKKETPATQACATCTHGSNPDVRFCDQDTAGTGLTVDQFIVDREANGSTCTKTGGTAAQHLEEKLCWKNNNAHNTAISSRATLEGRGYTCTE